MSSTLLCYSIHPLSYNKLFAYQVMVVERALNEAEVSDLYDPMIGVPVVGLYPKKVQAIINAQFNSILNIRKNIPMIAFKTTENQREIWAFLDEIWHPDEEKVQPFEKLILTMLVGIS